MFVSKVLRESLSTLVCIYVLPVPPTSCKKAAVLNKKSIAIPSFLFFNIVTFMQIWPMLKVKGSNPDASVYVCNAHAHYFHKR